MQNAEITGLGNVRVNSVTKIDDSSFVIKILLENLCCMLRARLGV